MNGMDPDTNSPSTSNIYSYTFNVSASSIDANGHVNNVSYVHWMQDLAIRHWESLGGGEIDDNLNCTWVARSHHIEYLKPAYEGEEIEAKTWIDSIRRVRSIRKYEFRRIQDDCLLARGETDWVFVDVDSGRPKSIPDYVGKYLANQSR